MGLLLITVIVIVLVYANAFIVRLYRSRRAGPAWWVATAVSWSLGAATGVWSGFFFEYRPLPEIRVFGAPIPHAFFHWEGPPGDEQWVDFITPAPQLLAGSNVVILGLLAACPVGLLYWLRRPAIATAGSATAGL